MGDFMTLHTGEPAPWVKFCTQSNPTFSLSSLAGRWVIFAAAPDAQTQAALVERLAALGSRLDGWNFMALAILADPAPVFATREETIGLRFISDADGATARQLGFGEAGGWLLLDPMLRIHAAAPIAGTEAFLAGLDALPAPADHAGARLSAPVLIVPRVFEPEICRRLVAHYDSVGGEASGVMREVDGRTVGVLDDFKRRRDAPVADAAFQRELRARILRRLVPEIERALQFRCTRIERYIVACYDAGTGGYFRPHRDNTTKGTAHRKFAVTINLNDDFDGGALRFPEFGERTYRPPSGGAVVFSCSMLHEATPVIRGRRYAFLPFLHDEEGERIRLENQAFLGPVAQPAVSA
jgi:predicted 2-oxoglutarate/Fe(II)-dependent dioxygenase YbiX